MPLLILFILWLLLWYAYRIETYKKVWNGLPNFTVSGTTTPLSVTVIIPVRNEIHHLPALLQSIEAQSYPREQIEYVFVDDDSTDGSLAMLQTFQKKHPAVRILRLNDNTAITQAHKKKAIAWAIKESTGSLIITTDADCTFGPNWISTLVAFHHQTGAGFIAAPVRINAKKTGVSLFQTLDFITLQGITGAAVASRMHVMCNGANLAYERSIYNAVDGFEGIDDIASGDDMLLMQKVAKQFPEKIGYLKNVEAMVTTAPVDTWKAFLHQRIRWASKAAYYKDKKMMRTLIGVYLFNVFVGILGIVCFFDSTALSIFTLLLLGKTIVEYPFVASVAGFFKQQNLLIFFPLFQPLHILYTIIAGGLGQFGSFEWKGRTIKK